MRQWIPLSTSPKGRLALAAVQLFGALAFDAVTVTRLADEAGVTTGAIYHHFGSKQGLYEFVHQDVEQRLLDRMQGALASGGVTAAMTVGFDFAVAESFLHLLSAPPVGDAPDRLAAILEPSTSPALARMLAAAWRASLLSVADGLAVEDCRDAVAALGAVLLPRE